MGRFGSATETRLPVPCPCQLSRQLTCRRQWPTTIAAGSTIHVNSSWLTPTARLTRRALQPTSTRRRNSKIFSQSSTGKRNWIRDSVWIRNFAWEFPKRQVEQAAVAAVVLRHPIEASRQTNASHGHVLGVCDYADTWWMSGLSFADLGEIRSTVRKVRGPCRLGAPYCGRSLRQ